MSFPLCLVFMAKKQQRDERAGSEGQAGQRRAEPDIDAISVTTEEEKH